MATEIVPTIAKAPNLVAKPIISCLLYTSPSPRDLSSAASDVYKRQLIIGLATRFGALAIVGTISVAIYHALVTSGFNIFLLELLLLYFASATSIALTGPGNYSLDEVIIRILKSEDEEEIIPSTKAKPSKQVEVKEETSKGGLFQFLQANILSDTSS